ncbi:MAG: SDR family NAD(P)-dependent oxidoreductase [Actinomycetota bacterium]
MDLGLAGKNVLVTGGAGGIGSAIVRAFAAEGARAAIHYRSSEQQAQGLAEELGFPIFKADLTVESEVNDLLTRVADRLEAIDVLVANAGMWPSQDQPLWTMSYDRWRATLAANLDSVFLCCRAYLRHVETRGHGNIVLVSSTAGIFGEAGHADYAAAKSALAGGLLKSLKNEIVRIAPRGRVNAVCPGWTRTDMAKDALEDPEAEGRITRTMSLRKLGTVEDVARAVVMLASDEVSGHITGQVITVAGGMEGRVIHS